MNKKYTEGEFEKDAQWIAVMARGYVVREFIEKWKGRVKFDDED